MPPSHPRPDDAAALGAALSAAADDLAAAGERLLDHIVSVGDRGAQTALDDVVDDTVDVLREMSAACRELALPLRAASGAIPRVGTPSDRPAPRPTLR